MAMGSKIELGRIVLYVFFPVAMFFYFNLPESYEDFMSQKKKGIYPEDKDCHKPPTTLEELKKAREKRLLAKQKDQQELDA